jgi:hypothetical protein
MLAIDFSEAISLTLQWGFLILPILGAAISLVVCLYFAGGIVGQLIVWLREGWEGRHGKT